MRRSRNWSLVRFLSVHDVYERRLGGGARRPRLRSTGSELLLVGGRPSTTDLLDPAALAAAKGRRRSAADASPRRPSSSSSLASAPTAAENEYLSVLLSSASSGFSAFGLDELFGEQSTQSQNNSFATAFARFPSPLLYFSRYL